MSRYLRASAVAGAFVAVLWHELFPFIAAMFLIGVVMELKK